MRGGKNDSLHMNARTRQSSSLIIWLVIEMSVKYKNPMEAQWSEKSFWQCGNFQLVRFYVKLILVNLESENCHFVNFLTKYFWCIQAIVSTLKVCQLLLGKQCILILCKQSTRVVPFSSFTKGKKEWRISVKLTPFFAQFSQKINNFQMGVVILMLVSRQERKNFSQHFSWIFNDYPKEWSACVEFAALFLIESNKTLGWKYN